MSKRSIPRGCCVLAFLAGAALGGCGGGESQGSTQGNPDVPAGSTALVAILNPVVNDHHSTGVPGTLGTTRDAIAITAKPGGSDVTADDGLAVVGVDVGALDLGVGDAHLSYTVQAAGDVYDAPIAYDGSGAAFFDGTPIRYAVGKDSGAFFFAPGDAVADIEAKLAQDDAVVVLGSGVYKGNLTITGKGVVLFGEGFTQREVTLEGSITANGEAVRVRGLTVTGDLEAKGNDFGISFSVVKGTASITGNGGAFVRNVFCGGATVPSSNATLLDNDGVAPNGTPPADVCK